MTVGSQVATAIEMLAAGRFEDAVISASVALSATARREHPQLGDSVACHRFLEDYLPIICRIGWVAFGVTQSINFVYRRLDSRKPGIATRTMPEMLYDVVRCTAIHEAQLPDNLRFTEQSEIQTGLDGELVLPVDVAYGLLLAVVASSRNSGEQCRGDPVFSFGGRSTRINRLWGDRDGIEALLGVNRTPAL